MGNKILRYKAAQTQTTGDVLPNEMLEIILKCQSKILRKNCKRSLVYNEPDTLRTYIYTFQLSKEKLGVGGSHRASSCS